MSLVNFNNFEGVASKFRKQREESKKLQKNIINHIDKNTEKEKNLDKAIKEYNEKVQQVIKNKQNDIDKINEYNKEMSYTLQETYTAFNSAIEQIMSNKKMNSETKEKKIHEISEYIMKNLYSKEEVEEFKKYANQFVILLPGNNQSRRVNAIESGANIKYK